MRIAILTYGTLGDLLPYVALGRGLQAAGYTVRIAAPAAFAAVVTEHGLDFHPLAGDPAQLSEALVDRAGTDMLRTIQEVAAYAMPLGLEVLAGLQAAVQDADAVIYSFLMAVPGHHFAQEYGLPAFMANLYPLFEPTGDFPPLMVPRLPLGPAANRLLHHALNHVFWQVNHLPYEWLRRARPDLPPLHEWPFHRGGPRPVHLLGYSPHVIPTPREWRPGVHVTGYWTLPPDPAWQPPADLLAFVEAGPPPVYVGFGSAVTQDAAALTRTVLVALARTGQRAILLGGWSGLGNADLPESIRRVDSVPHEWLFPRMAAVVHHGGAGTTAAGLRAGVPNVLVPFDADQTFWGERVAALGVGPLAIPRAQLTAERLAYALRIAAQHPAMHQRAAALGTQLRQEDGVTAAVNVITRTLESNSRRD